MNTRRTFLTCLASLPLGAWTPLSDRRGSTRGLPGMQAAGIGSGRPGDAMDEALEMLSGYAPSFRGGLSNHGPMAAEALVAMGQEENVVGWVDKYRGRLAPRLVSRKRIEAATWPEALGDASRGRDWEDWFANELAESEWRDVLAAWLPRLAPGMAAAGMHGVIRVGHAVCSLAAKETDLRRDELARALAYWASEHLPLPGDFPKMGDRQRGRAPGDALQDVELLPRVARKTRGLISNELKDLVGFDKFEGVIHLADPAKGKPNFAAELASTFAGVFANTPARSFEFLHAVTGAAAVAELVPYVAADSQRGELLAYIWQATAGIYSRYGQRGLVADVDKKERADIDEQVRVAASTGDEHTIKLAAACQRQWRRHQDDRLLAAATKRLRQHR